MESSSASVQLITGRNRQIMRAAQYAIVTGSVMVGAIGLGRGGFEQFLFFFLLAVAVSATLIFALLLLVIYPAILRRREMDALSIGLCSMAILPLFTYVLLNIVFGLLPGLQSPVVAIPLIAAVIYGALIGGHLRRLEMIKTLDWEK